MPTSLQATIEPSRRSRRPWRNRIWVRVALVFVLAFVVSAVTYWRPRRSMIAVWCVNGEVYAEVSRDRTHQFLDSFDPAGNGLLRQLYPLVNCLFRVTATDDEITYADLQYSTVSDNWLIHLNGLANLRSVTLNVRQLGSGLEALRECHELRGVNVKAASEGCLEELKRLPQIEDFGLWLPKSSDVGLDVLASLPKLRSLLIDNCRQTDQLLKSLPEHAGLNVLVFQSCTGFTEKGLETLPRLHNLKSLSLLRSLPIDDAGLLEISKLQDLETLAIRKSWGQVSYGGLNLLGKLKELKEITFDPGDLPADKAKMLQHALPLAKFKGH